MVKGYSGESTYRYHRGDNTRGGAASRVRGFSLMTSMPLGVMSKVRGSGQEGGCWKPAWCLNP
jgi:hypothetical protein